MQSLDFRLCKYGTLIWESTSLGSREYHYRGWGTPFEASLFNSNLWTFASGRTEQILPTRTQRPLVEISQSLGSPMETERNASLRTSPRFRPERIFNRYRPVPMTQLLRYSLSIMQINWCIWLIKLCRTSTSTSGSEQYKPTQPISSY